MSGAFFAAPSGRSSSWEINDPSLDPGRRSSSIKHGGGGKQQQPLFPGKRAGGSRLSISSCMFSKIDRISMSVSWIFMLLLTRIPQLTGIFLQHTTTQSFMAGSAGWLAAAQNSALLVTISNSGRKKFGQELLNRQRFRSCLSCCCCQFPNILQGTERGL